MSEIDSSIAVPAGMSAGTLGAVRTGITEWVGSWRNEAVSVGWDWGVIGSDRIVVLLSHNEVRTNILLISPNDNRPVPLAIAKIHLCCWIESLPWRKFSVND